MFDRYIFDKILEARERNDVTEYDTILSLLEEAGEIARTIRSENGIVKKQCDESSKVEIIDLCLVAVELFIRRGGTYGEANLFAAVKLNKWLSKLDERKA